MYDCLSNLPYEVPFPPKVSLPTAFDVALRKEMKRADIHGLKCLIIAQNSKRLVHLKRQWPDVSLYENVRRNHGTLTTPAEDTRHSQHIHIS